MLRTTTKSVLLAICLLAGVIAASPASADEPEMVVINGEDTPIPVDCARTGTGAAGQTPKWNQVPFDTFDWEVDDELAGTDFTTRECAELIFGYLADLAPLQEQLNGNEGQLLKNELFSGTAKLSNTYEVYLANIPVTAAGLASLNMDPEDDDRGLPSCFLEERFLVIHCYDDQGGRILLRDQYGNPMEDFNGNYMYLDLTGLLSQGGGTMYGNTFIANTDANPTYGDHWDDRIQHHEQVHGQQWARYGWNFGNMFLSEAGGDFGDALWFLWTYGKVEGQTVDMKCFNVFERAAGFQNGTYALRWNENGGTDGFGDHGLLSHPPDEDIDFPQIHGAYPNHWTNDSHNPGKKCPATWQ